MGTPFIDLAARALAERIERELLGLAKTGAGELKPGHSERGRPHYHQSFFSRIERVPQGYRVVLTNTAPHAKIIEDGSAPRNIVAHGKALRFQGKSGGTVYRRQVRHPGTKAYRILGGALETVLQRSYLSDRP